LRSGLPLHLAAGGKNLPALGGFEQPGESQMNGFPFGLALGDAQALPDETIIEVSLVLPILCSFLGAPSQRVA